MRMQSQLRPRQVFARRGTERLGALSARSSLARSASIGSHPTHTPTRSSFIKLEVHLEAEPEFRLDAESLREIECRFGCDALLSANDFAHQLFRPTDFFGERSLRETTRVELLPKNVPWEGPNDRGSCEFSRSHQW